MQIEVFYEDNTAMAIEAKYAKDVLVNRSEDDPLTTLCNCVIDEYGPLLVISC